MFPSINEKSAGSVSIYVSPVENSLSDSIANLISNYQLKHNSFIYESTMSGSLGNNKYLYSIIFQTDVGTDELITKLVIIRHNNLDYQIVYEAFPIGFYKFLSIVQQMIKSFTIDPNVSHDDIKKISLKQKFELGDMFSYNNEKRVQFESRPGTIETNSFINRIYVTMPTSNKLSVIDSTTDNIITNVTVGKQPLYLDLLTSSNYLYVANAHSDTISVIEASSNTVVDTIRVKDYPRNIITNLHTNKIFVSYLNSSEISVIDSISNEIDVNIKLPKRVFVEAVNTIDNTIYAICRSCENIAIYVIDGSTYEVLDTIKIQDLGSDYLGPDYGNNGFFSINENTNIVYALAPKTQTIYVINGTLNNIFSEIKVGYGTVDMKMDQYKNILYLSNDFSKTIQSYNLFTNKEQHSIKFNVIPPNAGRIICTDHKGDNKDVTNKYIKYDIDSEVLCKSNLLQNKNYFYTDVLIDVLLPPLGEILHPQQGESFEFVSWTVNPIDTVFDIYNNNSIEFNITSDFVNAQFKSVPPLLSADAKNTIFSVIVGLLIPVVGGWIYKRKKKQQLKKYMNAINISFEKLQNKRSECIYHLNRLRIKFTDLLEDEKITEKDYEKLEKKINEFEQILRDDNNK